MKIGIIIFSSVLLFFGMAGAAVATPFLLSTSNTATLGGLTFQNDDLVLYDPDTNTATLFFDGGALFTHNENIGAVAALGNGNIILSTDGSATLGGLSFEDGDLVEYNPLTDTATLFFDEDLFSHNEDIDAATVLGNGNLLLSTSGGATLGGLSFEDGDLVEYNPLTDTAALFFDEDLFSHNEDIDAATVLGNGNLLLSTSGGATLGGLSFEDGDLVEYNPFTDTATLFFDEDLFSGNENIDAISMFLPPISTATAPAPVPEPSTMILLGAGLIGLFAFSRKKMKR